MNFLWFAFRFNPYDARNKKAFEEMPVFRTIELLFLENSVEMKNSRSISAPTRYRIIEKQRNEWAWSMYMYFFHKNNFIRTSRLKIAKNKNGLFILAMIGKKVSNLERDLLFPFQASPAGAVLLFKTLF